MSLQHNGLGDSQRYRKQLRMETGALQRRGGPPRASCHLHLLLPAQHHILPGILGPQGEPYLELASRKAGAEDTHFNQFETLHARLQ